MMVSVHRKVKGAVGGGSIGTLAVGLLDLAGVHLSAPVAGAVATLLAALVGWLVPAQANTGGGVLDVWPGGEPPAGDPAAEQLAPLPVRPEQLEPQKGPGWRAEPQRLDVDKVRAALDEPDDGLGP